MTSWMLLSCALRAWALRTPARLKGAHIYRVGSWQGCGCSLVNEPEPGDADDEAVSTVKDRDLFARYLDDQLRNVPVIGIFVCLDGNQHEPACVRQSVPPTFAMAALGTTTVRTRRLGSLTDRA